MYDFVLLFVKLFGQRFKMVLWEITLATAYFLGLRRTYRLALKIQRSVIPPRYPRIRQFANRRTRDVFDVALKVHRSIQERDLEVGRNLGNWILRWLDKAKPSAQIRPKPLQDLSKTTKGGRSISGSSHQTSASFQANGAKSADRESDRHFFSSSRNMFHRTFPRVAMIMRRTKPSGAGTQYRHLSIYGPQASGTNYGGFGTRGAIRDDIMMWMLKP